MITSLHDWLLVLRSTDRLVAFPLMVGGVALMLFGFRMWKLCVVLSFGLIGMSLVTMLTPEAPEQWVYAVGGGILLGGLSYFPANYSVAILGGMIGGGSVLHVLSPVPMADLVYWSFGFLALFGSTAYAFINRRLVVIMVTALLGAALLVSGLTAMVMFSPPLYGTLVSMATGSVLVVPFILLVPTVVSCFFQVSEAHRMQIEL